MNNMINISWAHKYMPKTYDDIIMNKNVLNSIKKWIINDSCTIKSIMVIGPHGSAKNSSLKIMLNSIKYDSITLSSNNIKNKQTIYDTINSYKRKKNMPFVNVNNDRKLALIICDTETINLTNKKNNLLEICKLNDVIDVPIIFIANAQKGKFITSMQKICPTYEFMRPNKNEIMQIIIKIMTNENIKVCEQKIIDIIIDMAQYDIRRLIHILQDICLTFTGTGTGKNETIITLQQIQQYLSYFQKKDIEIPVFDATRLILNNYRTINQYMNLYEANKTTLPLTCHENYYRKIFAATKSLHMSKKDPANMLLNQLKMCSQITNASSIGDNIETNIYIDQNWINQNIHGLYTVVNISQIINSSIDKLFTSETPQQQKYVKEADYEICHSLDLHKTSLKNINRKQLLAIKSYMPNKNLTDILYINKIIYDLFLIFLV
jgi:DNA polymerase III delta prime subunit